MTESSRDRSDKRPLGKRIRLYRADFGRIGTPPEHNDWPSLLDKPHTPYPPRRTPVHLVKQVRHIGCHHNNPPYSSSHHKHSVPPRSAALHHKQESDHNDKRRLLRSQSIDLHVQPHKQNKRSPLHRNIREYFHFSCTRQKLDHNTPLDKCVENNRIRLCLLRKACHRCIDGKPRPPFHKRDSHDPLCKDPHHNNPLDSSSHHRYNARRCNAAPAHNAYRTPRIAHPDHANTSHRRYNIRPDKSSGGIDNALPRRSSPSHKGSLEGHCQSTHRNHCLFHRKTHSQARSAPHTRRSTRLLAYTFPRRSCKGRPLAALARRDNTVVLYRVRIQMKAVRYLSSQHANKSPLCKKNLTDNPNHPNKELLLVLGAHRTPKTHRPTPHTTKNTPTNAMLFFSLLFLQSSQKTLFILAISVFFSLPSFSSLRTQAQLKRLVFFGQTTDSTLKRRAF